jgi:hypothetical protein
LRAAAIAYYYSYGLNIDNFGLDYLHRGTPRTYGVEVTVSYWLQGQADVRAGRGRAVVTIAAEGQAG